MCTLGSLDLGKLRKETRQKASLKTVRAWASYYSPELCGMLAILIYS